MLSKITMAALSECSEGEKGIPPQLYNLLQRTLFPIILIDGNDYVAFPSPRGGANYYPIAKSGDGAGAISDLFYHYGGKIIVFGSGLRFWEPDGTEVARSDNG